MSFDIIDEITEIETIAKGSGIREWIKTDFAGICGLHQ